MRIPGGLRGGWSGLELTDTLFNWRDAKFLYSRPPVLYSRPWMRFYTGPVRSGPLQKAGRERGCIHTEVWKNPANQSSIGLKFGWYGKVNQKSGWFANLPFHSRMNRKGRSSSGPLSRTMGTRKCISLTELVTLS